MRLHRILAKFLLLSGGIFLAAGAQAQIVGSQHDLTSGGAGQGAGASEQVCVYCHTPHGSDVDAPVPLWNKNLNDPGYTRYSSLATPSFDSVEAPVGSVSLACLSCHDGTQAMDVVINAPGSDGFNAAGAAMGSLGVMIDAPVPMLEQDLSDDHPISMQYAAGGPVGTDTDGQFAGALGDTDFVAPQKATINAQPIWWVDSATGAAGTREKTDMLLYTRTDNNALGEPFVECGSCHDPHNASTQISGPGGQVAFLRISNAGSAVCVACHNK